MKPAKPLIIGLLGAGALAGMLALSAWAGTTPAKAIGPHARPVTSMPSAGQPLTLGRLTIAIYARGPRLEHVVPANFAVQPGVPLTLTFVNHTTRFHTFTSTGLGVSFLIKPGTKHGPTRTVVTFTPRTFGVFSWKCVVRCGDDMAGKVYAVIGE
jgi:hypothetical protein